MKNLKELINESFSKEYGYRIKLARDCSPDDLSRLEGVLAKYNLVSATPWKRLPIQENPMEFQRLKGVNVTYVVLKYPVNQRILEVLVCVEMNMNHDHVLCYGVNDPRRIESEMAEKRLADDKDRSVEIPEAQLEEVDSTEDQEHYTAQNEDLDLAVFGEEYNSKFLAELQRIKAEKGADYFKNYPTKDELMGDDLRAMHDSITGLAHGGNAPEAKQADTISQSSRRN
jgi:hypothetical protein